MDDLVYRLKDRYLIIVPELDGHGFLTDTNFESIQSSATKILKYLCTSGYDNLEFIGGFSVGAQITSEILMKNPDIMKYAIIESGCEVYVPAPKVLLRILMRYKEGKYYKNILDKICPLPREKQKLFDENFRSMDRVTVVNTSYSNLRHRADNRLKNCKAKVIDIHGGKEPFVMKYAAYKLSKLIPNNLLLTVNSLKHGGISIWNPDFYVSLIQQLPKIVFD